MNAKIHQYPQIMVITYDVHMYCYIYVGIVFKMYTTKQYIKHVIKYTHSSIIIKISIQFNKWIGMNFNIN